MPNIPLVELERMAHYDCGHKSKEALIEYIGYLWMLLQESDNAQFKAELVRDYGNYLHDKDVA